MSANAIIWWVILVVMVVVLALAGVQAARALRELKRLQKRVADYAELPVVDALGRAEDAAQRLESAGEKIAPLIERAQVALAVIRRGPIPPELIAAARNLRAEIAALRTFASR